MLRYVRTPEVMKDEKLGVLVSEINELAGEIFNCRKRDDICEFLG